MDIGYLKILLTLLAFSFLIMFFIFTTTVAVYLKIFIQKRSGAKEFILSKNYTGGIPNTQFEWMHYFGIFYDFFMLFVLSFASYSAITFLLLGMLEFNSKPYQAIGLYLFLILLLVVIMPIDKIESITKPRWIFTLFAPKGITITWRKGSRFGYIYNFISKYFIYIFLLLAIFSFAVFSF